MGGGRGMFVFERGKQATGNSQPGVNQSVFISRATGCAIVLDRGRAESIENGAQGGALGRGERARQGGVLPRCDQRIAVFGKIVLHRPLISIVGRQPPRTGNAWSSTFW